MNTLFCTLSAYETRLRQLAIRASLAALIGAVLLSRPATAQFAAPVRLDDGDASGTTPLVVIFYANESDAASLEPIAAWLEQYGSEAAQLSARKIRRDMQMFAPTVARQVADLSAIVAAQPGPRPLHLMVFTNELSRAGQFLHQTAGTASLSTASWDVPDSDETAFQINPLSNPQTLEAALLAAAGQFSPTEHQFALIAKSHGSDMLTLGGLAAVKLGLDSYDELVAAIQRHEPSEVEADRVQESTQGTPRDDTQDLADPLDDQGLAFEFQSVDPAHGDLGLLQDGLGTSKDEFSATLSDVAERCGMRFDLVLLDSCRSELSAAQTAELAPHVTWLVGSTGGTHYQSINYARLSEVSPDFLDALLGALQTAAETQQVGPAAGYEPLASE